MESSDDSSEEFAAATRPNSPRTAAAIQAGNQAIHRYLWPLPARSLANRVHRAGHGPVQPSSVEYRLGHFAAHEGLGPRALDLVRDMLFSDLHHEVREGLCSQAMLAGRARLICARFDALRSAVNQAVAEGTDAVWVCEPVDREAVISNRVRPDREHSGRAVSAPVAGQPAYGARGRNTAQTRRVEPYDFLDTRRLDALNDALTFAATNPRP